MSVSEREVKGFVASAACSSAVRVMLDYVDDGELPHASEHTVPPVRFALPPLLLSE
jgi:hypothetical protein